jgi:hypothetical protein
MYQTNKQIKTALYAFLQPLCFLRLTAGNKIHHRKNQTPQQKPSDTENTEAQPSHEHAPITINPLEPIFPNASRVEMI